MPFYFINGDFIVNQDQLETHLLQLFAHPYIAEWFYFIYVIFYVNIAVEQKHA